MTAHEPASIMLSKMLSSVSFFARRNVSTTVSRQLSETTGVSKDAREFVKLLKNDGLLLPLFLAFGSVFGFAHYSVSNKVRLAGPAIT